MSGPAVVLTDYRVEFAQVKRSLDRTCRDLAAQLTSLGLDMPATQVREATAFLDASLRSLDRTLRDLDSSGMARASQGKETR